MSPCQIASFLLFLQLTKNHKIIGKGEETNPFNAAI